MKNFEGFGLSQDLNRSLAKMNYATPTPIQEQAIPLALKGRDVLGTAQTGTGKTAAFSIPLVEQILRSPAGNAMVLTPTRELAKQVLDVIHQLLGRDSGINTAFIIGGDPYGKQLAQLKARPRIIVGTPGRINDHLERGTMMLNETGFLVLDETDRMLDMGFGVQIDKIITFLPKKRQTLMFSATLPDGIMRLSSKYLHNPERISMGETNVIAKNIKQDVVRIEQGEKYKEMVLQLHDRNGSVIVFVKTKHGADKMAKKLRQDGFTSEALHGDLRQNKREKVMNNFRKKNFRVLIATDIAARGLDVPHIEHVINYDLPQVAEDYIHRIGRTARAGASGSALCFVSPQDGRKWHAIQMLFNPEAVHEGEFEQRRNKKPRRGKPYRGRPVKSAGGGYKGGYKGGSKPGYKGNPKPQRAEGGEVPDRAEGQANKKHRSERPEGGANEGGFKKPFRKKKPAHKHKFARSDIGGQGHPKKKFKSEHTEGGGNGQPNKFKPKYSENGGDKPQKRKFSGNKPHGQKPAFKSSGKPSHVKPRRKNFKGGNSQKNMAA